MPLSVANAVANSYTLQLSSRSLIVMAAYASLLCMVMSSVFSSRVSPKTAAGLSQTLSAWLSTCVCVRRVVASCVCLGENRVDACSFFVFLTLMRTATDITVSDVTVMARRRDRISSVAIFSVESSFIIAMYIHNYGVRTVN